ncbi:MAG: hypothetical protein IPK28_14810 [Devosia sp.]|nr:hypothetical protein [Devosia sp.]
METKEQLGGILIIEAADMAEALEIAQRGPMADFGAIEVRAELDVGWQKAQQGRWAALPRYCRQARASRQ